MMKPKHIVCPGCGARLNQQSSEDASEGAMIPPNECPNYRRSYTADDCFTCLSATYFPTLREWDCKKHHCTVNPNWVCDDYKPRWVKREI